MPTICTTTCANVICTHVRSKYVCSSHREEHSSLFSLLLQAQQALIAAQQQAANAPPKQVDGWVPTRSISDLFVAGSEASTPTGRVEGLAVRVEGFDSM